MSLFILFFKNNLFGTVPPALKKSNDFYAAYVIHQGAPYEHFKSF